MHVHEWIPVAGTLTLCSCACGDVGFRRGNGEIKVADRGGTIDPEDEITARPTADYLTGRRRALIPDDWEPWDRQDL